MGTVVSFDLPDHTDPHLLERACEWLHRVEKLFSVFIPDSEVSRIGRGELSVDHADPAVRHVITRCDELRVQTEGAFRHRNRTPDRPLDPSGYVKGWSIERALLDLRLAGVPRACIGAGGDIAGYVGDGSAPWKIGIRNPDDPEGVAAIIDISSGAVATSGEYERGAHIDLDIDHDVALGMDAVAAASGGHAAGAPLSSVSVVGPDLGVCDALATAIWAAGSADGDPTPPWMSGFPDYDVLACTVDGRVVYSERLESVVTAG